MKTTDRSLICTGCAAEYVGHYARKWCDSCKPIAKRKQHKIFDEREVLRGHHKSKAKQKKLVLALRDLGITLDEFNRTLEKQQNRCAICRSEFRTITEGSGKPNAIYKDHDHKTGEFRGLLCGTCNRGLGLLGDDLQSLRRAVKYLETSWRSRTWDYRSS